MISDIYRKNSVIIPLSVKINGTPMDLTNCTLSFVVKKSIEDIEFVINKQITNHIDAANGLSQIMLLGTDTDIMAGHYYYDISLIKSDGQLFTLEVSEFNIKQGLL